MSCASSLSLKKEKEIQKKRNSKEKKYKIEKNR